MSLPRGSEVLYLHRVESVHEEGSEIPDYNDVSESLRLYLRPYYLTVAEFTSAGLYAPPGNFIIPEMTSDAIRRHPLSSALFCH